jgi:hypothetical protein
MILAKGSITDYVNKVKSGKIKQGLGLNNDFVDEYIRYKQGQMNMILGFDNVGKSYWFQWYALAVSSHHDIKWTIWMGEDEVGETMINLIQMYSGKRLNEMDERELQRNIIKIEYWFSFVDPSKIYTPSELLTIFKESDSDAFFIDPYTGLKRGYGFSDNYDFLNEVRQFCNDKNKTVYISLHPSTESGRNTGLHAKGHMFEGYIKPPKKADAEGGQSFANRADDFYIIHRYNSHPTLSTTTQVHVVKNKRNRTGGKPTLKDNPVMLEFNNGFGFTCNGIECIARKSLVTKEEIKPLSSAMSDFDKPIQTELKYVKPDDTPF